MSDPHVLDLAEKDEEIADLRARLAAAEAARDEATKRAERWRSEKLAGEGPLWDRVLAAEAARDEATKAKDGAYRERDQVVALLARMALALGWRAGLRRHEPDPDPTWDEDWKNVVAIDLPSGQVTWHFHDSERPLFHSLPTYPASWDGHDTPEKYRRVNAALSPRFACVNCGLPQESGSGWWESPCAHRWALAASPRTTPPEAAPCGHVDPLDRKRCVLASGHGGSHRTADGVLWSAPPAPAKTETDR